MKKKTEYKKIILAVIAVWAIVLTTVLSLCGVATDVATALVYGVVVSYAAYCGASASDKYGLNKYGATLNLTQEEDENNDISG